MAVKSDRKKDLPSIVHVGTRRARVAGAACASRGCRRPSSSASSAASSTRGRQTRDLGKLSTLGSGGRSSATSLLSLTAVRSLRRDETLEPRARKLLAFTDNRQDASLQAGHLNDTVEVGPPALRALPGDHAAAGAAGLGHDELAGKVADALGLDVADYAIDPAVKFAAQGADGRRPARRPRLPPLPRPRARLARHGAEPRAVGPPRDPLRVARRARRRRRGVGLGPPGARERDARAAAARRQDAARPPPARARDPRRLPAPRLAGRR